MKTKNTHLFFMALFVLALFSCITVNIYFPEATVKKAAEEIVDEIRKKDEKDKGKLESEKTILPISQRSAFLFVPAAYAQEETNVSTPAIRALKQSLKDRFPNLKVFFDSGSLGEGNNGYVEVRDESGLSLKDKAALRNLVKDENNDRMNLYAEVAKALNIDASLVSRVQKIFAETWIKSAAPGWWVQKEDGEWVKKQ